MNNNKPLLMAHAGGMGHGRENSIDAFQKALKYNPDIIELDIRKSLDGVLFCYHGFPLWRFLLAYFLRLFPFPAIKKFIKVNTLSEIIATINNNEIILFLDIKDRRISSGDIRREFIGISGEVWIAAFSVNYLKRMKKELGGKYKYIYNFSFLNLKRGIQKAKQSDIDMFKLFPSQCNEDLIEKMRDDNLKYTIHAVGSVERYKDLLQKYGSVWVAVDDLRKPEEYFMGV